jgi:hypothetical protein
MSAEIPGAKVSSIPKDIESSSSDVWWDFAGKFHYERLGQVEQAKREFNAMADVNQSFGVNKRG